METLTIIFLAVVQGLTEFLPLSSSGHLLVLSEIFDLNPEDSSYISMALHSGTLLSIILYFHQDLLHLISRVGTKILFCVIAGTIPAAFVGGLLSLTGWDKILSSEVGITGIGFLVSGMMLQYAGKLPLKESNNMINLRQAFIIGLCQSLAVVPGISRIGAAFYGGLWRGLGKFDAARFSIMLSIPVIGGMVLMKMILAVRETELNVHSFMNINLSIGFAVAAITGYLAIELLLKILKCNKINLFSGYLFLVGWTVIVWRIIDTIKG
jgi:undecaprenyl-diphosphatase